MLEKIVIIIIIIIMMMMITIYDDIYDDYNYNQHDYGDNISYYYYNYIFNII